MSDTWLKALILVAVFGAVLLVVDTLVGWLAREGSDARYGARPLQRVVEQQVVAPLARWLVAHRNLTDAEVEVKLGSMGVEVAVK